MDLLLEKEKIGELFDWIVDHQIEIFRKFKELGAHGVMVHEDWGSSKGLIMSPKSWREIFKPRYMRGQRMPLMQWACTLESKLLAMYRR